MKNAQIIGGRRIASDRIATLGENEIFVFGSNIQGSHGGGAAWFAYKNLGAEWGVGEGLTGRCYALPTMEGKASMKAAVDRFIEAWSRIIVFTTIIKRAAGTPLPETSAITKQICESSISKKS